jgi:hypothetical protein
VSLVIFPGTLTAATARDAFLTGPTAGTPLDIAVGYLESNAGELGLSMSDLTDFAVSDQYLSKHNGVTHVYLQQRLGGVEVVNGLFNVNVMSDGRILNYGNRFVANLADSVNTQSATIEQEGAIASAARHLGLELDEGALRIVEAFGGPPLKISYDGAGISRQEIPVELKYLPLADGSARLVWSLLIDQVDTPDFWNVFVDATTGEVLDKHNWTAYENRAPDGYLVFATPRESPDDGPATTEVDPADPIASPFGWHDTNGAPGAESTLTIGNNVAAQTDVDADNTPGAPDIQPDGGPSLEFLFPADLGMQPSGYQPAAVTNLFYWNNIMHDLTYQYGFDEPAGNFQVNNYGNGGLGGDPVQADAQDGSGTNNANFLTNPDGSANIRMQMYVWIDGGPLINGRLTVNGGPAAGDYEAARGSWGGSLDPSTTADLELVSDGGGMPTQGCGPLVGFTPGNVALIDRGTCEFGTKALNAENAGAVGAIIVNDQQLPNGVIAMGAGVDGGSVTIPAIMIGNADGQTIRNELPGVNVTMQCPIGGCPVPNPINRDSDLDNGVIAHEYGHGISNRLTGGPSNVGCLQHPEQAGEGWSDWWTLSLFPDPSDTGTTIRGVGNYVTFQPIDGLGIRNFPYTTDIAVNPQTYADIGSTNIPHGVGEIWAEMLWEMYWNLVDRYGFDPDLYTGTGGNNLAIQLVIDGMKLQNCTPTFVDARNAILAADVADNGGANECEIWHAFAKRGLGFSASAGGIGVGDEVEAFDLPPGVPVVCDGLFADGFESGDFSAWDVVVP